MRSALVVMLAGMIACKSGSKVEDKPAQGSAAATAPTKAASMVQVAEPHAVTRYTDRAPVLVVIDDANKLYLSAVAPDELATTDPLATAKPATSAQQVGYFVAEVRALGIRPADSVEDFDAKTFERTEESAVAGTVAPFEEGTMGKKDSDRAAGSYRMKKPDDGTYSMATSESERERLQHGPPVPRSPHAETARGGVSQNLPEALAIVVAAPRAKASMLVEVLRETRGITAVAHAGGVRMLRLYFPRSLSDVVKGTELPLGKDGDLAALVKAVDVTQPVDLVVGADVDAQRLVDAIVALEVAGAKVIGLGAAK